MILTIANLKGGSTRTTTAMLLACAFTRMGYPVTVVDTDHRQSATRWNTRAQDAADPLPFPVISHPLTDQVLHDDSDRVAEVAQFDAPNSVTIIDTPSHTPQMVPVTAQLSDVVLVPFATSPVDYYPTVDTLRAITTPHAVLMTKVDRRTREEADLRQRLQADGTFVLETTIAYRMFFNRIYGTTPGTDLHGYTEAAQELETIVESLERAGAGQPLA